MGVHQDSLKRYLCTPTLTAALFAVACPLLDDWLQKLWFTQGNITQPQEKGNRASYDHTMDPETVIQSEVTSAETQNHMTSLTRGV